MIPENKKSHNDYWGEKQFFEALNSGCNIIEADVICVDGELYCSHSWRPWSLLTYGKLKNYFTKFYLYREKNIYLYLEIKSSNYDIINLVSKLIEETEGKIKILVKGINRWFSPDREFIAKEIYKNNKYKNVQLYDEFKVGNQIESVDIYKNSNYKFWNRF